MNNEGKAAANNAPRRVRAREIARDVIGVEVTDPRLPYTEMGLDFVYGEVWSRPGLTRKERRWITLACVGASAAARPIEMHVRTALATGDITLEEMREFVLHFAAYAGFPRAQMLSEATERIWDELQASS